ncbi:hypothetical protein Acr_28g0005900 [Actinidia rufa]|uniref:Uncharacterized protein n=1 Tax=Actinidia rufa TaxID=165716 RepID=A0A7J0HA83_9ERIC|nr:hypothetical protein Acr_28g0005900 [Actinidia rufa]
MATIARQYPATPPNPRTDPTHGLAQTVAQANPCQPIAKPAQPSHSSHPHPATSPPPSIATCDPTSHLRFCDLIAALSSPIYIAICIVVAASSCLVRLMVDCCLVLAPYLAI